MKIDSKELIPGIKLHLIKTDKFKTDLSALFMTIPLKKETATIDCVIPAVLQRGTANLKTQEEINKKLEEMYGTSFDCGIDKIGDNHVIKFYAESIDASFVPDNEELLRTQLNILFSIAFNPVIENGMFKQEYVESEKENIRQKIREKIDNKEQYAVDKCIEAMYKEAPYALYKYGNEQDLKTIDAKSLFDRYQEIIKTAKIDIFVSGNIDEKNVKEIIAEEISKYNLIPRESEYIQNNEQTEIKEIVSTKTIEEKLDVAQGKLILGLDVMENKPNSRFAVGIFNVILGESATSKLFQNVREKASLAYSARSIYIRQKNNIFIRCGIEIPNYEKALNIILKQLDDMKDGNFTDEDIENAKKYTINGINSVEEEQDTEITYYMSQELSGLNTDLEQYAKEVKKVTKEQIIDIANKIQINTILFLRN